MKGTYYATLNGKQTDIFTLVFNKENKNFFDIEIILDSTDSFTSEEQIINFLKMHGDMYNPIENKDVSFNENKNMDLYIETYAIHYSSAYMGIRMDKGKENE